MDPGSGAGPEARTDSQGSGVGPPAPRMQLDPGQPARFRLEVQNRINEILARADNLDQAAPEILREIAEKGRWVIAGLWLLDPAGEQLRFVGAWPREDLGLETFLDRSFAVGLAPGEGLPGVAWQHNRPTWIAPFEGGIKFLRLEAAKACGLQSGCCFPIRLGGRVLGIMEFFSRDLRAEESDFLDLLDNLGNQIGQFEGRKREEAALRRSEARFRAVLDQAVEGIFLLDLDGMRILEANRAFLALTGYSLEELKRLSLYQLVDHDVESVDANALRAVESGDHDLGERRYRRKDGGTVAVEVRLRHLGLEFGRVICAMVHDVSSARLAESERVRLLEILEATSDFVGMADLEGRVFYGNKALAGIRGPDSPDLKRPILEAHPAWAAKIVLEDGLPAAIEKGVWRGETALLDRDGHEIPVSQVIVAHRDASGRPTFFSTIARDITEQKHNEHHLWTLLKNYQDLKYAVDESNIFAVTDANGRILDVNARFCEVAGYRSDELLGQDHRILNSGYHPKAFFKELWDTIKAGRVWRGEIRNRAKDGSHYWVDATIVPWLGKDGRPERFISLRTVVTDRKRAEERLRTREAQLEVLLQTSREMNTVLEIPAVFRKLILAAIQLTGAKAGAAGLLVEGEVRFSEYFTGEDWAPIDYRLPPGYGVPGHVLRTGEAYIGNDAASDPHVVPEIQRMLGFRNLIDVPIWNRAGAFVGCFEIHDTLDGRPFGEEDLNVLRGLADTASVALHNAQMIAEREQQEAALRHVQKIESLGVLAGGIAHDFNNLLAVISGNVALAQLNATGGREDGFLASIDEAVQRAADLTHQLLAYAGKGRSVTKALDLNRSVEEMSKLLAVSCSKKAELQVHLQPGLPRILADPAQIQQVVMNLVINASDALEGREGWIRISTGVQDLPPATQLRDVQGEFLPAGRHVVLAVADSGCGMGAEVQARIFDPFYSTKATGRGLGLSAMLGILRSHGARIQLESAVGSGSTFTVYFRPGGGAEETAMADPRAGAWKGSGRLLLVDDEEQIRHAVAPLLRSIGFEVVEAAHGREAVARYQREGPFRLVLMDLSMPHMDGMEAFREIRALDPAAKVILLSGYNPTGSLGPEPGLCGFLQKPFRLDQIREALRKALDGA